MPESTVTTPSYTTPWDTIAEQKNSRKQEDKMPSLQIP
jgi:hypothetical protein